ncbi:MAG: family 43 glycosylhydrolase, partial [Prevotellaceae bacterium]|nr:family 43 glycosylhydrolase [Prevotellaceae bacterium]MDD6009205.1 family 43 glycosylhydrolase [Prevotellaceae bacterium]
SKDMKTWTLHVEPTMSVIPKWAHDSVQGFRDHVWAPDIIRYRDRWWLAYSCSTFGKNTSAIGLLSTRDLTPGCIWDDEGPLVCSREGRDNWNAIDANFVIDDNDQPWLVFGSFWDGIQMVPLDSTMHIADKGKQKTIARRFPGKKENPVEAPFIFKHGSYYYLFVSWDYCCKGMDSTYKVVVGRSRKVDGPYFDRDGKDMAQGGGTLVIEGDKKEFEAAGHNSAYTVNGTDIFLCHGYSVVLDGASILIKKEMIWSEDGWPKLIKN